MSTSRQPVRQYHLDRTGGRATRPSIDAPLSRSPPTRAVHEQTTLRRLPNICACPLYGTFTVQQRRTVHAHPVKNCATTLAIAGVAAALVSVAGAVLLGLIMRERVVSGRAASYEELATIPAVKERLDYFPRRARNVEYWLMPRWNGISGSFDINVRQFMDWARQMGWNPTKSSENLESVGVYHADGSFSYVTPRSAYFYEKQSSRDDNGAGLSDSVRPNQASRYFSEISGHFRGPPRGE